MNLHCVYKASIVHNIGTIKLVSCYVEDNKTTVLIVSEQLDSHPLPKVKENIHWNCYWQQQAIKTHAACTSAALREIFIHGCWVKQSRQWYQGDKNSHCWQGEKHSGRKQIICFLNSRFGGFFSRAALTDHSCILWDHVRNTINDGICDTKLFVY